MLGWLGSMAGRMAGGAAAGGLGRRTLAPRGPMGMNQLPPAAQGLTRPAQQTKNPAGAGGASRGLIGRNRPMTGAR